MTPAQYQRVNDLFLAASRLPASERAAYIESACDGDAAIRAAVEQMLANDWATQSAFLEPPVGVNRAFPPTIEIEGYEIIRELHRGGQGIVYQAIQKATKRKVAMKVLLEGPFASTPARKRFEREIELVGQLKHPNIIEIFHYGQTANGHQYCVMEYVRGVSLAEHVRQAKLPLEDTLRLFMTVCDAVNYAHLKGVIHRDVKPSNVLVDSDGVPHVLDFGLARQMIGPVETIVSITGQIVGTLAYMSPEQAVGNPDKIDTRTDVYSLGVMLYELLTGKHPYPVTGEIDVVVGHIKTTDPTPPSRQWTIERGIARRSTRRLRPGTCPIDGELQTIVLKALAKDKERRYQSAGDLARDLGRYLAGEAIEAKRESTLYVIGKLARRHRSSIITIAIATVAVLAIVVLVVTIRRHRETRVTDLLQKAHNQIQSAKFEQARESLLEVLDLSPESIAAKRQMAYVTWQESKHAGEGNDQARLQEIRRWCDEIMSRNPDDAWTLNQLGLTYKILGRNDKAIDAFERSLKRSPSWFAALVNLGTVHALEGDMEKADRYLRESIASDPDAVDPWRNLASFEWLNGEFGPAEQHIDRALEVNDKDIGSRLIRARIRLAAIPPNTEGARTDAEFASVLQKGESGVAKRLVALAWLRAGDSQRAVDSAMAALRLGDLPAINHFIIALAQARLGDKDAARQSLAAGDAARPAELREPGGFIATADEGVLWFETHEELGGIRSKVAQVLGAE